MYTKLSALSLATNYVKASYSGHGGYGSEIYYKNLKDDCFNFNGEVGCTSGS